MHDALPILKYESVSSGKHIHVFTYPLAEVVNLHDTRPTIKYQQLV